MKPNTRKLLRLLLFGFLSNPLFYSCQFVTSLFSPTQENTQTGTVIKTEKGIASYYADKYEGKPTASGEPYRKNQLTGAHRTLPFGTKVRVTNLKNQKAVVVRINDRGPFVKGRIIDVSRQAAEQLDFIRAGLVEVKIEVLK
ncbi:septal ring lytic transglycosylase RlpA family protein [Hugenholtzia roseola]|uniref:septal ring lytic transglycosylase RlpA family protein n=1 Tax=Hugenholtzia roseola TaxID=1002 RepID=UPI000551BA13|nr:septal ring lytic transglycosylase RlpA family protein [Hugenholtzia roseola]